MKFKSDLYRRLGVCRSLCGVIAVVLVGLGFAACAVDRGDESTVVVASDDTEESLVETTTTTTPPEKPEGTKAPTTTVGLVDEKVGLEAIVDDFLTGMWARDGLRVSHEYAHRSKVDSDDPATKLRGDFEQSVFIELGKDSSINDPYFAQLYGAVNDGSITCFVEALGRKPTLEYLTELFTLTAEQEQELYDELGWDEQQLRAVEDRCWIEALEFRSLGEGEGERLLDLQRKYYLDVAREWAAANPDLVVPLPG